MKDYTICAYMRLSDEDSDVFGRKVESGSITSQRRLIMDFINSQSEFKGCRVIEKCDDGLSGRYFDTRPQFMEMIELAKKGKVNCIIVKDCSRFGRDYVELGDYLEQLFPFLGVRFIAINDHYDSSKTEGGLDIAFKNLVYDIYSRDLSKKVKESRRQMALQGKYIAGQILYGYRKKKGKKHQLELDPEAAPIVREIFDMRLSGIGPTEIAKNLNERDIKCPTVYRHKKGEATNHGGNYEHMCWTGSSVMETLSNENYTGSVVSMKSEFDRVSGKLKKTPEKEWIRIKGMHEAIVSLEEFQRVQDMIQHQASPAPYKKQRYRCGICGRGLNRRNGSDLYCSRGYVLSEDCECRNILEKEEYLDEIVLRELKEKMQRVMDAESLKLRASKGTPGSDDMVHSLKSALAAVKEAKQALFEKLADRSIDRDSFKKKKREFDAEIQSLEQKISDAQMADKLSRDSSGEAREKVEKAKSFLDIKQMTDEIWEKFVKDVFVYPGGRMEIQWNFEE